MLHLKWTAHEGRLGCKFTWAREQQIRDRERNHALKKPKLLGLEGTLKPPLTFHWTMLLQPGLKHFQEWVPLENTISGLKLHENLHLFPILLIPTLRGTKHEQRLSCGLHRLRYLGKERKSCYLLPSLQLCNFNEVDLQLLPTGNAWICKLLLQNWAFVGIWSHSELKAVGKKSRFHPVWLQQYTQVGWVVRHSQLRRRNAHLFPLQAQITAEL